MRRMRVFLTLIGSPLGWFIDKHVVILTGHRFSNVSGTSTGLPHAGFDSRATFIWFPYLRLHSHAMFDKIEDVFNR